LVRQRWNIRSEAKPAKMLTDGIPQAEAT